MKTLLIFLVLGVLYIMNFMWLAITPVISISQYMLQISVIIMPLLWVYLYKLISVRL